MRWRLAVLLALWLGTLALPFHALPPFEGYTAGARAARGDQPVLPPRARPRLNRMQTSLVLQPAYVELEGCNGLPRAYPFRLVNNTGAPGTFDLDYLVPGGDGTLAGPPQLSLADGQVADFEVTLIPGLCVAPGEVLYARIDVSGNGRTTSAEINHAVHTDPRWEMARQHPLPCFNWLVETAVDPGDGQEYVYVAGCTTRSTYRYDPRHDTWTTLAAILPDYTAGGDGATYQGRIYARSDGQGSRNGWLYIYDVETDTWSSRAVPNGIQDRFYYEAVELGGKVYFLGGEHLSGEISAAVDRYDPATGTWASAAPMLYPRALAMAWVYLGKIYVAGGRSAGGPLSSTEMYDPASDTWTENPAVFAPLPAPRLGAGDAILDGRLWLTGGFDTADLDGTLYWSAAGNSWLPGPNLAGPASQVESAVLAGHLYTVGGLRDNTLLVDNQRLVVCPDRSGCRGWLEGRVYDAELPEGLPTCSVANLGLTPGSSASVDPATGSYGPLPLLPGRYLVEAWAPGYSLEAANVSVEDGITTTHDIGLWRPRVEAGPWRFHVVTGPGASLTLPLRITNTGHLALEYQLLELASTPADDPGDELPWLRPSATGGEIAPSQAATVELTFECTAAQDGQVLGGRLGITHGDPCVPPITIELELACKDSESYVYLPLLIRAGEPRLGSTGTPRRKGSRQPGAPPRTRP
ncbi:MAG TPA: kelch repeat-containing protein [Anaerolineae bacterium]|nr:kelch repeat-containing protein [Anaerolineae bacterium]